MQIRSPVLFSLGLSDMQRGGTEAHRVRIARGDARAVADGSRAMCSRKSFALADLLGSFAQSCTQRLNYISHSL